MIYSFPNQRTIKIHREAAKRDFLGIKNENWQAAARDLGAHSLMLYLYLASNADGYNIALSPVAVRQAIGMARSTYHDQFHRLVDKGYLIPANGNTFEFYEVPQTAAQTKNEVSEDELNFEAAPSCDIQMLFDGQDVLSDDIQINNTANTPNNNGINNGLDVVKQTIQKPQIKEIVIQRPKVEGKKSLSPKEEIKKAEFIF